MATTYTENYNLGMQADSSDKFDMSVITDDMELIDAQLKANADAAAAVTPTVSSVTIDNDVIDEFYTGTMTGVLDAEITGDSAEFGVVRAYTLAEGNYVQFAETISGARKTRYYNSTEWSAWA